MPKGVPKKTKQKSHLGEIAGVIFIALGIFIGICIYIQTGTGILGGAAADVLFGLLGIFAYLAPFLLIILGVLAIAARKKSVNKGKVWLITLLIVSVMSLIHTFSLARIELGEGIFAYIVDSYSLGIQHTAAGVLGSVLVYPFYLLIGDVGCVILFITSTLVCVLILANISIRSMSQSVAVAGKRTVEKAIENVNERKKRRLYIEDLREDQDNVILFEPEIPSRESFDKKKHSSFFDDEVYTQENEDYPRYSRTEKGITDGIVIESYEDDEEPRKKREPVHGIRSGKSKHSLPPVSLLSKPQDKAKTGSMEEQRKNAMLIEETLENFGVEAKVVHIVKGPAVTRYELRPAPGVRVRRIKELDNDLAMTLAAKAVKIEAPIPGKAAVGVEVPNSDVTFVHLRSMLEADEFKKAKSALTFALGKDITGKNYCVDITAMPHILIAGETGSGKSVCINSLITSILFKATPDEVKMILIDPKVVELSGFKNIPHLLVPVVTDPKKASSALNWAVSEMTSRYKIFAERGARDINRFNDMMEEEEKLPRIVVIIDELAELMMAAPREVEDSICRIAQLGRAAGIHLVVATQRPSVNVITGLIKANISSRIAFKVNSGVDSRTILDQNGAEKLLRNGDMLYHPSDAPKPIRLQGCYVSDSDIEAVVDYVSGGSDAEFDEDVVSDIVSGAEEEEELGGDYDELLPKAVEIVLEYGQASISMLQRRLRIGYARAARLVDEMEVRKIVSPFEGSKARQVLITWDMYEEMFGSADEA